MHYALLDYQYKYSETLREIFFRKNTMAVIVSATEGFTKLIVHILICR